MYKVAEEPDFNTHIKLEAGLPDLIHIEIEYLKQKLFLTDCVMGKVWFTLVHVPIHSMELSLIRREYWQGELLPPEILGTMELMDGAPTRGEYVPFRLFLRSLDVTPTFINVSRMFTVKYYLCIKVLDEREIEFFKM